MMTFWLLVIVAVVLFSSAIVSIYFCWRWSSPLMAILAVVLFLFFCGVVNDLTKVCMKMDDLKIPSMERFH